jgi:glycosyltransferase involved in cell wall biosynthesis
MNDPLLHFSIIIPAHNEERCIGSTLEHVRALEYPEDKIETFVIENGSKDRTLDIAKQFESANVQVLHNPARGVSAAKNLGIDRLPPESDWVVFLDADVTLDKNFLNELDLFLRKPNHFTVGTTTVRPLPETPGARLWFAFYDLIHRYAKKSFSIQVFKRSLFPQLRFDEKLTMNEDLHLILGALAYGDFFFLPTRSVHASTRRFDEEGYWKLFFSWTIIANLPQWLQPRFTYKVIR